MFTSPAKKISDYLINNGIKQTFVSQKTGISKQTLNAKLKGVSKLTSEDIELICGALGKEPNDFLIPRMPHTIGCDPQ